MISKFGLVALLVGTFPTFAQAADDPLVAHIHDAAAAYTKLAQTIWRHAEVGYQEVKSSQALQKRLRRAGFHVQAGVADMPTAFVAEWGSGRPVVALLAEFDALPGLSQQATPTRVPRHVGAPGHGCGHHLFGVATVAAAESLKARLQASKGSGTVRVYGTPAEEGGSGKVYMARAGLFQDVDVVLHWHPNSTNDASPYSNLANRSALFRFRGKSAHAAGAPEQGRSALDGVEAMNYMVNLLREHIDPQTRIHYVIRDGGLAPNVVPDFASVYYYVRHPQVTELDRTWKRVLEAAQGAAQGTGTSVEAEIMHGNHPLLPNHTLARVLDEELRQRGGISYTAVERVFAARIRATLDKPGPEGQQEQVEPFAPRQRYGSTDVGDISWLVPTAGVRIATWVPGTPSHSWQAVATGGMSIGFKGMLRAAEVLAGAGWRLLSEPTLLEAAQQEFRERRGVDFVYKPLVGDRTPPLNYRNL